LPLVLTANERRCRRGDAHVLSPCQPKQITSMREAYATGRNH
jgi:hypothetical protein